MRSFRAGLRPALVAGLAVLLAPGSPALAQKDKKADFKSFTFKSHDGVDLAGYFHPSMGGAQDKDAVVLLLHHFDPKAGGDANADGLPDLASRLQRVGYNVLRFDFRGFGGSTSVGKDFWNLALNRHNQHVTRKKDAADTIDRSHFKKEYWPFLVNDIAAAKFELDRRNDKGEVNTSNLFVIGAQDGAALGAMWLYSEWHRRRQVIDGMRTKLDEPEGKDVRAAVWLSLSPTVAGRQLPMGRYVTSVGRIHRAPIVFVYGAKDDKADDLVQPYLKSIRAGGPIIKGKEKVPAPSLKFTGTKKIPGTDLKGTALLRKTLDTEKHIVKYLNDVLDDLKPRASVPRGTGAMGADRPRFFYTFGKGATPATQAVPVGILLLK